MTDFGRRPGDMFKSDYDANLDGIVDALLAHKLLHQSGGTDEISVAGLLGELAAAQASTWTKVTGKPSTFAPAAHKTSHQTGDGDAIDCTALVGRVNYVDRGDPSAYDKAVGDFTTNNVWNDLDLNLIVPTGAIAIHFKCTIQDGLTGQTIAFRENGNAQAISSQLVTTQVADVNISMNGLVTCDSGRVIEYRGSNTTFTLINFVVTGWLI